MGEKKTHQGSDEAGDVLTLERVKTKQPRPYVVVMHNDDYTTQEFVVGVLVQFFNKSLPQANRLMLTIHTQGKAKVASYTRDLAETKVQIVTEYARAHGMPLLLTAEPE